MLVGWGPEPRFCSFVFSHEIFKPSGAAAVLKLNKQDAASGRDAPTLFCVAIDWILEHMSVRPGINIGNSNITDLVYADDTALLLPSIGDAASCLSSFSTAAAPLGLKISWE